MQTLCLCKGVLTEVLHNPMFKYGNLTLKFYWIYQKILQKFEKLESVLLYQILREVLDLKRECKVIYPTLTTFDILDHKIIGQRHISQTLLLVAG